MDTDFDRSRRMMLGLPLAATIAEIDAALSGDVGAATRLVSTAPSGCRAAVVYVLHDGGVRGEALRRAMQLAWDLNHEGCLKLLKRRRLVGIMKDAAFELPPEAIGPGPVRIWRGIAAAEVSARSAARGLSWTLNRDVACWFAMRQMVLLASHQGPDPMPCVVVAEVPQNQLVYFSDERLEREVIPASAPRAAEVDGTIADWQAGFDRWNAGNLERTAAQEERVRLLMAGNADAG